MPHVDDYDDADGNEDGDYIRHKIKPKENKNTQCKDTQLKEAVNVRTKSYK